MTRGNQRDIDRARALQRAAAGAAHSTLKDKDLHAAKLREKQAAADARKEAEAAAARGAANPGAAQRNEATELSEEEIAQQRAEAERRAAEYEARIIRENEELAERRAAKKRAEEAERARAIELAQQQAAAAAAAKAAIVRPPPLSPIRPGPPGVSPIPSPRSPPSTPPGLNVPIGASTPPGVLSPVGSQPPVGLPSPTQPQPPPLVQPPTPPHQQSVNASFDEVTEELTLPPTLLMPASLRAQLDSLIDDLNEEDDLMIMPLDDACVQLSGGAPAVAAARQRIEALLAAPTQQASDATNGGGKPLPVPSNHSSNHSSSNSTPHRSTLQPGDVSPTWPALPSTGCATSSTEHGNGSSHASVSAGAHASSVGANGTNGPSARRACCWGSDGTPERRVRDAGPLSSTVVSVGSVAASTGLPPPTTPQGRARAEQLRLDAHIDAAYANDRNRGAVVVDLGEGGGVDGEYDANHGQSAYHVSPNAEETLEELLREDGEGVMEIDIPREAVGKVIGTRGCVINAIRQMCKPAEIKLSKDDEGNGTLLVQGLGHQLDQVASIVQLVVTSPESDPDVRLMVAADPELGRLSGLTNGLRIDAGSSSANGNGSNGGGNGGLPVQVPSSPSDEEYVMPLPPDEAKLLDSSRQLSSVMRLAGVRMHVDRSSGDGWVNLTIRGSGSAIENAKQRIEGIVNPGLALAEPLTPELGSPHALPHGEMNAPVPELLVGASGSGKTDFRIEIELTNKDQVGAVIGEGGRTINAIRSSAGASIQVEREQDDSGNAGASTQRRVIIVGSEQSCMAARRMVHDVLKSNTGKRDYSQQIDQSALSGREGGGVVRLTVPRHLVGRVIGKRGATIKRLRERTGAVIEIAKDESTGIGTVTLSGADTAVRQARQDIEELTQEDLPLEVQQMISKMLDETIVINVPPHRVGKVIGSRGAVIQGLRQETGVAIDLQKDDSGAATVTLRGSMEAMRDARAAIERIVAGEDVL